MVLLVISNRVITPINFQNLLVKHVPLFADTIFGKTTRSTGIVCLMEKILEHVELLNTDYSNARQKKSHL